MSNMQGRPDSDNYQRIFLQDVPLIDVRAPIEFQQGAFAQALNLPLMIDSERQAVGTCYKQHGQQAAIALGHSLVNGKLREQRTAAWLAACAQRPEGYLYCFRGGLRSQLVQQWLHEAASSTRVSLAVIRRCAIICSACWRKAQHCRWPWWAAIPAAARRCWSTNWPTASIWKVRRAIAVHLLVERWRARARRSILRIVWLCYC